MKVYEDMLKSPDLPKELSFRVMLKELLVHPFLRNKVKNIFRSCSLRNMLMIPEKHAYDPPKRYLVDIEVYMT